MTLAKSIDRQGASTDIAGGTLPTTIAVAVLWALLWAAAFVTMKAAVQHAPPMFVVGLRCALAGLVLLGVRWRRLRKARAELGGWTAAGLLNNTGYLGVMGFALPHLSAGMAAVLSSGTPLLVLSAGAAGGRRRLRTVHVAGLVLGVAGIALSAVDRMDTGAVTVGGVLLGACAVVSLSAGTLLTPRLVRPGADPLLATGWQALTGAVPLLILSAATGSLVPRQASAALLGQLLFLALGASVLGMTLWLLLIQRVGPGQASIAQFMPPLFSIALGALFLGDSVTLLELLAVLPVAVSTILATRP